MRTLWVPAIQVLAIVALSAALPRAEAFDPACAGCASAPRNRPPQAVGSLEKTVSGVAREVDPCSRPSRWRAVGDAQVAAAACRRKVPFTSEEMLGEIRKALPDDQRPVNETVFGYSFRGEAPAQIGLFRSLVTAAHAGATQTLFRPAAGCHRVQCALSQVFGKREGVQLAFMLAVFGFNGSHLAYGEARPWRASELDEILAVLSDLPRSALKKAGGHRLVHRAEAGVPERRDDDKRVANERIEVTRLWDQESPESRQSIVLHEIAHRAGVGLDQSEKWRSLSGGWREMTDEETRIEAARKGGEYLEGVMTRIPGKPETVVSDYGMRDEREDFAESLVAYRYNPACLKAVSPEKYVFLKDSVFDGAEFNSDHDCLKIAH